MLLDAKKAKIRELTNNGPVPEARFPEEPDSPPSEKEEEKPKRGRKSTRGKAPIKAIKAPTRKPAPMSREKRKRTPTPEPEIEDEEMPDVDDIDERGGSATAEESVQGDDERDENVERMFEVRDDGGDITDDEEL